MARRDPVCIRLLTRRGNDWSNRFPLIVEAVNHLKVRSCLIDGEVVCCDEREWPPFKCSGVAGTSRGMYGSDRAASIEHLMRHFPISLKEIVNL